MDLEERIKQDQYKYWREEYKKRTGEDFTPVVYWCRGCCKYFGVARVNVVPEAYTKNQRYKCPKCPGNNTEPSAHRPHIYTHKEIAEWLAGKDISGNRLTDYTPEVPTTVQLAQQLQMEEEEDGSEQD